MAFGPFSTLPNGLPNMFGLTGQAMLKSMQEELQMQLDALEFLAGANALEVIGGAPGGVNNVGLFPLSGVVVPDGECWLLRGISAGWVTLAGEALRARLILGRTLAGGNIAIREISNVCGDSAVGVSRGQIALVGPPLILYPSDFIGISVESITTGGFIQVFQQGLVFRFNS